MAKSAVVAFLMFISVVLARSAGADPIEYLDDEEYNGIRDTAETDYYFDVWDQGGIDIIFDSVPKPPAPTCVTICESVQDIATFACGLIPSAARRAACLAGVGVGGSVCRRYCTQ